MNEKAKQEKVRRFLADEVMAYFVKDVLRESFLKQSKDKDVQYLAASRIAIDFLEDGFKELAKYKSPNREEPGPGGQIGL